MEKKDITICCVKWGDKFKADYVNKLHRGVARHIKTHRYDFVCFTENTEGIDPEIRTAPLLCPDSYYGWWQKLGLFQPALGAVNTERILYFDLGCVMVGDLDKVIDLQTDFAICQIYPPELTPARYHHVYASGAFLLKVGAHVQVWDRFDMTKATPYGDQLWIEQNAPNAILIPHDWSPSYKLRHLKNKLPENASWVMFHGVPKPHECGGWVKEHWI